MDAENSLAEAKEKTASFTQPQSSNKNGSQLILTPSLIEEAGEKQANLLGGMMGGMGLGLTKALTEEGDDAKKEVENQIADLDSPEHMNEIRKIRAQTALTRLMSDPESPLSEYDPAEVMQAYNDITQLSPRLADQPSALGPLLNRRLMGNTEPFELGETLKLEESLKKTQPEASLGEEVAKSPAPEENKKSDQAPGSFKGLIDMADKGLSDQMKQKSPTDLMKNEASILS